MAMTKSARMGLPRGNDMRRSILTALCVRCNARREMTNVQIPNPNEIPISNDQDRTHVSCPSPWVSSLGIGHWALGFHWDLGFGHWDLSAPGFGHRSFPI